MILLYTFCPDVVILLKEVLYPMLEVVVVGLFQQLDIMILPDTCSVLSWIMWSF